MHPDQVAFGIGLGQPFGFVGGNLLLYPQRNIGLFAGAGYDLLGLGYNVGVKLRFMKAESNAAVNFYLTGMYGYTAVIKVTNGDQYNKTFYATTLGFGLDIHSRTSGRGYWTVGLLFPMKHSEVNDYITMLKNVYNVKFNNDLLPITFTVGYMFVLN